MNTIEENKVYKAGESSCADQDFLSDWASFDLFVFLVDEGIQIPIKTGHQRPAGETPGVPMMTQH